MTLTFLNRYPIYFNFSTSCEKNHEFGDYKELLKVWTRFEFVFESYRANVQTTDDSTNT